jgi:hypothetical protein
MSGQFSLQLDESADSDRAKMMVYACYQVLTGVEKVFVLLPVTGCSCRWGETMFF